MQECITSWSSHIILIHHPAVHEEREREQQIFSECIVERNAIEFGCFFMCQPLLCAGYGSPLCGQTPWEKRRAWSRCLPVLLQRSGPKKDLNEALPSEAAGPNQETMPLGNFEDQQQLKMQLHYINYAFMLLSWPFLAKGRMGGGRGGGGGGGA